MGTTPGPQPQKPPLTATPTPSYAATNQAGQSSGPPAPPSAVHTQAVAPMGVPGMMPGMRMMPGMPMMGGRMIPQFPSTFSFASIFFLFFTVDFFIYPRVCVSVCLSESFALIDWDDFTVLETIEFDEINDILIAPGKNIKEINAILDVDRTGDTIPIAAPDVCLALSISCTVYTG